VFSVTTNTMSPTARFLRGYCHFWRICSSGRYSRDHLFQKTSARYCTWRHLRRQNRSSLWKVPGGIGASDFRSNKWFGVKGSKSLESSDTTVKGRLFRMLSTSHIRVASPSSSVVCSWRRARRIFSQRSNATFPNASVVRTAGGIKAPFDALL